MSDTEKQQIILTRQEARLIFDLVHSTQLTGTEVRCTALSLVNKVNTAFVFDLAFIQRQQDKETTDFTNHDRDVILKLLDRVPSSGNDELLKLTTLVDKASARVPVATDDAEFIDNKELPRKKADPKFMKPKELTEKN